MAFQEKLGEVLFSGGQQGREHVLTNPVRKKKGRSSGIGIAPTPLLPSSFSPRLSLTRCSGGTLPLAGLGSCLLPWSHLGRARAQDWTQHALEAGIAVGSCEGPKKEIRRKEWSEARKEGEAWGQEGLCHSLGVRLVKGQTHLAQARGHVQVWPGSRKETIKGRKAGQRQGVAKSRPLNE